MQHRILSILILGAIIVTIAAISVYRYIPPNKLVVIPSVQWKFENVKPYQPGVLGVGFWAEDHTSFRCYMPDSAHQSYICTFDIILGESYTQGYDLSKYTKLVIDADYVGAAPKMDIYFRNYNSSYSKPDDYNSAKFMKLSLNTRELTENRIVSIYLNEFSVADWWTDQRELERKYLPLEFSNVILMGFDFSRYIENVDNVSVKFRQLYFEGPRINESTFYFVILLTWVGCATAYLAVQFFALISRNRAYTQQIHALASDKEYYEKQSEKYKELSHLDPLTSVLNRLGMLKNLKKISADLNNFPISVVVLDIDHFKRVNDQRGHDVGDLVILEISRLVQANIRTSDLFGRWGGEEFVLFIPATSQDSAYNITEKLRRIIANHKFQLDKPLTVTCSFGIAAMNVDEEFDLAFKRADKALYRCKQLGRNCSMISRE